MAEPPREKLTYDEYLALERATDVRHEFLDGEVHAMAGGTLRHAGLKTNLTVLLGGALAGRPCRAYDSDAKVRIPETGLATYPDLAVVCGPVERHPDDRHAMTNPVVLVEVLSKDSESWDRGDKFAHYRRLPSLRHYLLVSQDKVRVEHFVRQGDAWVLTEHGPGAVLRVEAIGVDLAVDDLYRDLPDEPPDPTEPPTEA